MEIEYQSGNHWITVPEERTEEFILEAAEFNKMTPDQIIMKLSDGECVNYDQGWDYKIRDADFAKKEEERINKLAAEHYATRHEREKKDYLATHDHDWYEDY